MSPSRDAAQYWHAINRTMIDFDDKICDIWKNEKRASVESIYLLKEEALQFLASERERIMKLSREDAVKEILQTRKIDNRIQTVKSLDHAGVLDI